MVLERLLKAREKAEHIFGLPPLEKLGDLLTEENTKRVDSILRRLEKLSRDKEGLKLATRLLETVENLARSGDLERLDSILSKLPTGKRGQDMLEGLQTLFLLIDQKVDKLQKLAETILSTGD